MSQLRAISGCEQGERKADVVFIHGLGGDAFTTWRHGEDDSTSWPHWLGREFPDVGVWSLGYAASPTKWTRLLGLFSERRRDAGHGVALPDRALQVLDLMAQRGLGDRPLCFICHSLGGLVAKQILRTSAEAVDTRLKNVFTSTRAVLFLATPHAGAALASLADTFRTVFGATVTIEDLRAHDAHLRELLNWYRNHAAAAGIETATYYELRSFKGVIIVNPTSAHPGVGVDPVGLDEDHISIAKPRDRDAQVCGAARGLLRSFVLARRPAPAVVPPTVPAGDLVPHELPPRAEEFFGREADVERLAGRLRSRKNTAVVGLAGLGKTALAAEALLQVVGDTPASLAASPYPDGVVYLDLYTFHGEAEAAWDTLANRLAGAGFMQRSPARDRATEACRARDVLVVIEGGEEADGQDGRAGIAELLSVLSPENRWLLLTRLSTQSAVAESVVLRDALPPEDAAKLLDFLTQGRVAAAVRDRALRLLEGHPLALTWAGNLLARDDEDPERLAGDWAAAGLPRLSDPRQARHTLEWLFNRSVRGLDHTAKQALAAAALLARAPFPLAAIAAASDESGHGGEQAGLGALKSLAQRGLLLRRPEEADHWQFAHVLGYRFAREETGSDPAIRTRLGQWLHAHLTAALAAGRAAGEGALSLARALEHLAALLRADDDHRLWEPLAKSALYDFGDRLTDLGRLGLVKLALGAVEGWLDRFPPGKAEESYWLRERSSLDVRQGGVLSAQGDLAGALAAYGKSLEVSRRLAEADPSNAGWQRDLSVSQEKIGNVLRDQGDLAGALAAYGKLLEVSRRLAEADPSNAGWQRDLSFSLTRMAEFNERQGDRTQALRFAEQSLMIDERLATLDRSNVTWQKDVAVSRALVTRLRG